MSSRDFFVGFRSATAKPERNDAGLSDHLAAQNWSTRRRAASSTADDSTRRHALAPVMAGKSVLNRNTSYTDIMAGLSRPPAWHDDALCSQVDVGDMFFPEKGGSTAEAKTICAGCDVREQCLEWALENQERFGIFGGKSERERRRILAERRGDAA
ncbi:WhiB-like regulatory protein [Gordonia phage BritBrat]|uniref:WhiB-like regulatory protein n=1 Tax=Gordonia phage BritBrat TaxID=1838064 RepID=A0A161HSR2_9CAUD|nr:WhiB-like regulatory protein [Gordonia phage BritBrat]ANA85267.1 WhiB-like regulatory protein [Gordonia phage BritBrat]